MHPLRRHAAPGLRIGSSRPGRVPRLRPVKLHITFRTVRFGVKPKILLGP